MRHGTTNLLINLGLLCGSLAFFIGTGEIALRALGIEKGRVSPPPIYRRSESQRISYELKPSMREYAFRSLIVTNSLGFRSPEPDGAKPVLAVLGDSITFGYGVENDQSLPARLQQALPAWDVQNGAVPGYNMMQESATYNAKMLPLNPKALLLVFYWNDLQDLAPAVLHDNGNLYPPGAVPPPQGCAPLTDGLMGLIPGKCWLDTHSAIYRVLKKAVVARTERANQAEQVERLANDQSYEYVKEDNVVLWAEQFREFASRLPADLPKLFVIWPERPLHARLRPRIRRIAEEQGFTVVDLYNTFGNNAPTHPWDTVHPNADTIQKAAAVLKQALDAILPQA